MREKPRETRHERGVRADLWPQLFSDVSCIALWISSEKILTRLYSVLHWFHKRLEANVKKPRENRCFQTVIVFSFSSFDNSNKCTVLLKIAARLITVSTSVNKEMWVKLRCKRVLSGHREVLPQPVQKRETLGGEAGSPERRGWYAPSRDSTVFRGNYCLRKSS